MSGDAPLRILQILRAPVGGLFRHVSDLTEELAARGHTIGIVVDSLSSDALTGERLGRLAPLAQLGIHYMPMPRTIGPGDFATPLRTRRLAASLEVDVLHGHGAKGGLAARIGRTPRAIALNTPHGGVLNYRPGSVAGRFFRAVERGLGPLTDAYIFESAFAQRAFHEQIGAPPCREAVIHNGLKPAEFEPLAPAPNGRDFVFIGEFREVKGIDVLLAALAKVTAPDGRPATLAMAGGGPEFDVYKAQIQRDGLADRVDLLGVRPAREALSKGRCLVVPSRAESLPYVVLEGASAGLPVIATNVGGVSELFGPTSSSLLKAGDIDALAAAMRLALADPAGAAREAQTRLDYIRPRFSVSHMADQIVSLYRDCLTRRRGGG